MRLDTLKYFFEAAKGQSPAFYYRGTFQEEFTNHLVEISEGAQHREGQQGASGKKISFILVECFQNILKHAEDLEQIEHLSKDEGLFSFHKTQDAFVINSINLVINQEVGKLESLVQQVNSFSPEELKRFYLENLQNNEISDRGGAGLGLIEMARKSGEKILHRIDRLNDDYSLFHQQITMRSGRSEETLACKLDNSHGVYNTMNEHNILLMYKGDFSQKSILPLLQIAEQNNRSGSNGKRSSRASHITVEVLQNISKHARSEDDNDTRNGMFILGSESNKLFVLAGNIVSFNEKIVLEEKLDYLLSLDENELNELHRTTLRASLRFEHKNNSGLGLIEVAQASKKSMAYTFFPQGENQFLFALYVNI